MKKNKFVDEFEDDKGKKVEEAERIDKSINETD